MTMELELVLKEMRLYDAMDEQIKSMMCDLERYYMRDIVYHSRFKSLNDKLEAVKAELVAFRKYVRNDLKNLEGKK